MEANRAMRTGLILTCALAAMAALGACGKKSDAEMDKKAEKLGEEIGAKMVVDMAKKQLADTKTKFAAKQKVDDECSGLRNVRSDVLKAKTPEAEALVKDINSFCTLDVKVGARVAELKTSYDKMMDAQKKKERDMEQLYWAGFSTSCTSIKRDFEGLKEDNLEADPKAKELQGQVDKMCSPENVAKKKYFT